MKAGFRLGGLAISHINALPGPCTRAGSPKRAECHCSIHADIYRWKTIFSIDFNLERCQATILWVIIVKLVNLTTT